MCALISLYHISLVYKNTSVLIVLTGWVFTALWDTEFQRSTILLIMTLLLITIRNRWPSILKLYCRILQSLTSESHFSKLNVNYFRTLPVSTKPRLILPNTSGFRSILLIISWNDLFSQESTYLISAVSLTMQVYMQSKASGHQRDQNFILNYLRSTSITIPNVIISKFAWWDCE